MRSSNALTNSAGLACILAGLLAGGCGTHGQSGAAGPAPHGSVNLDILVRQHPGWSGVTRYDDALRRLNQAEQQAPRALPLAARATVPALAAETNAAEPAISPSGLQSEQRRLEQIEFSHLAGLSDRRVRERRDQLARQASLWQGEADRLFPMPESGQEITPDLALQLQQVNVEQLTRTVQNWSNSPESAPRLAQVKAELARAQETLNRLIADHLQAQTAAQAHQAASVVRISLARSSYTLAQAARQETALRSDDERLIAAQRQRLTAQRFALLQEAQSQTSALVPADGSLGPQALPTGPEAVRATLSQESLAVAAAHLRAQRARWIAFLYDDTRAAALDTARQRGWTVDFARPLPGERDLTTPLAQALATGAWRPVPGG